MNSRIACSYQGWELRAVRLFRLALPISIVRDQAVSGRFWDEFSPLAGHFRSLYLGEGTMARRRTLARLSKEIGQCVAQRILA